MTQLRYTEIERRKPTDVDATRAGMLAIRRWIAWFRLERGRQAREEEVQRAFDRLSEAELDDIGVKRIPRRLTWDYVGRGMAAKSTAEFEYRSDSEPESDQGNGSGKVRTR